LLFSKFLLPILWVASSALASAPGELVAERRVQKNAVGIDYYAVEYTTRNVKGDLVNATGMIAVPKSGWPTRYEWISYQHGTTVKATDVPSRAPESGGDAELAIKFYGSNGYIVVCADGIGLGKYRGPHPLLHLETEAGAAADLLVAAKTFFARHAILPPKRLYLAGYSQGAHSTVALHRELEEHPRRGIRIAASFPMDGPYDLSDTMLRKLLDDPGDHSALFGAYAIFSMQTIYGDVVKDWSEAFIEPVAARIPQFFSGDMTSDEVRKELPKTPLEMLKPEFVAALRSDPEHPLRRALRKNDIYDWHPHAPLTLIHSKGDTEVPFENSLLAQKKMAERGADVKIVETAWDLDHIPGFVPAITAGLQGMIAHARSARKNERD
jgi:fermentation-respiration switch protein FrsA (DUF1100 family)